MRRHSVAVAFLSILLCAPPASAGDLLPKPDWVRCTWNKKEYACLDVEQTKHYLELFVRYKDQHATIQLLEEELTLHKEYTDIFTQDLKLLMERVDASNGALLEVRDILNTPDPSPYTTWDLIKYTAGALIVGLASGYLGAQILK